MPILSNLKLVGAGLFLVFLTGVAVTIKVQHAKIGRLEQHLAECKLEAASLRTNITEKDRSIQQLQVLIAEADAETGRLKNKGESLEKALRAKEAQLASERGEWVEKEAALNRELPAKCEDKIREMVRRIIATVKGAA